MFDQGGISGVHVQGGPHPGGPILRGVCVRRALLAILMLCGYCLEILVISLLSLCFEDGACSGLGAWPRKWPHLSPPGHPHSVTTATSASVRGLNTGWEGVEMSTWTGILSGGVGSLVPMRVCICLVNIPMPQGS